MAPLQKAFLLTTCLFLFSWGSALAQGLPPATLFGTGQQICNYQYAIPNGGNCVTYGPALEQKLSAVQQDMDRIKLQYVSTNSVLREELRKLRQQVHWEVLVVWYTGSCWWSLSKRGVGGLVYWEVLVVWYTGSCWWSGILGVVGGLCLREVLVVWYTGSCWWSGILGGVGGLVYWEFLVVSV